MPGNAISTNNRTISPTTIFSEYYEGLFPRFCSTLSDGSSTSNLLAAASSTAISSTAVIHSQLAGKSVKQKTKKAASKEIEEQQPNISQVIFECIHRIGFPSEDENKYMPRAFSSFVVEKGEPAQKKISAVVQAIKDKTVEIIIIPDNYITDEEVLQTLQVRDSAHKAKNGIAICMSSTDAKQILEQSFLPEVLLSKVYKISTIRHGDLTETVDPSADLLLDYATSCVMGRASQLTEIVIRACYSAGHVYKGLADPITNESISYPFLAVGSSDEKEALSRQFLHAEIGIKGDSNYDELKRLTIRTQTLAVKNATLVDSESSNVLFTMRKKLDSIPYLQHLSVKAYYEVVNPVPENNPTRMGLWSGRKRLPNLTYPKAVRLISPSYSASKVDDQKPNHLTRSIT